MPRNPMPTLLRNILCTAPATFFTCDGRPPRRVCDPTTRLSWILPLCFIMLTAVGLLPRTTLAESRVQPEKVDLYLLTIDVGRYQNPEIPRLLYVSDDARAMRAWADGQKGRLYNQVFTDALSDRQANRSAIIQKIIEFYENARPQDQLILYMAGHGVVPNGQSTWHFLPVEANPDAVEGTGLEQDDILAKLESSKIPHQRVLILTDSCQSGALAAAVNSGAGSNTRAGSMGPGGRGLNVKTDPQLGGEQLHDKTSLWLVFAAGTALDKAEEGEMYKLPTDPEGVKGHGVFTWAILQALDSQSADTDRSGTVTLSEFVQYVSKQVAVATQQRQIPVMSGRFMDVPFSFAPDSMEICDGKDNDMDGMIDEGFPKTELEGQPASRPSSATASTTTETASSTKATTWMETAS